MANPYMYNNYGQYSPPQSEGQLNTSPTFHSLQYATGTSSASSTTSSAGSNYSAQNPRLRYYLSKSFDAEDDLEFCPEIPEYNTSPTVKKFNPYTASVFSPTGVMEASPVNAAARSPRANTPRIRKAIEIINPHTKVHIGSPATPK